MEKFKEMGASPAPEGRPASALMLAPFDVCVTAARGSSYNMACALAEGTGKWAQPGELTAALTQGLSLHVEQASSQHSGLGAAGLSTGLQDSEKGKVPGPTAPRPLEPASETPPCRFHTALFGQGSRKSAQIQGGRDRDATSC